MVVLVVDDDKSIRKITKKCLENLGHRVNLATNAEEALQLLKRDKTIELLITDNDMPPGIKGVDLICQIQPKFDKLKIILMSGKGINTIPQGVIFIQKPFTVEAFLIAISSLQE